MNQNVFFLALILAVCRFLTASAPPGAFKQAQLQYPRVKTAYAEKLSLVKGYFTTQHRQLGRSPVFLRAFKQEGQLEVWAGDANGKYVLVRTYAVCAASGTLGPKWRQGDRQVPEGLYVIDKFNPNSSFHLSLGINYPNAADQKRGGKSDLGGDIFIHGNCVTIGCLPLTDDKIKELYVMAVETCDGALSIIPLHIFPARFTKVNWQKLQQQYRGDKRLILFWQNLKTVYDSFEKHKQLPRIQTTATGSYQCSG